MSEQREKGTLLPSAGFDRATIIAGTGRQLQNERHGELRHRLGRIVGDIADSDSTLGCCIAVDNVCAGGGDGDQLQFAGLGGMQYRSVKWNFVGHSNRLSR